MSKLIEIQINDVTVKTHADLSVIEAADLAGIYIPRFCYHQKLSVAANCRMCLVEIEKSGKPLPACATPVTSGMKIYTQSKKALRAQRNVMEFLLINHPLDCPVCDQGGECELQDVSMGYGGGYSHYQEPKRAVYKQNIGPLIETNMTRCIHCTRCVRFGEEIAGVRELGATGRGEDMQIGTYIQHFMTSEVSGNVIDLCPVGALTSKPYRYTGRAWEMQQHPMVSMHDSLGSHLYIHTRAHINRKQRSVMRVLPQQADDLNESWLSDRDRFSYQGLEHAERLKNPWVKRDGKWQEVSWQVILPELADRLRAITQGEHQHTLAALVAPNTTTEAMYLLQKLCRGLGSNSIDYRYRQTDFRDQESMPVLPVSRLQLRAIDQSKKMLLIGSHLRHEAPLIALRVRAAVTDEEVQAAVASLHSVDYPLHFSLQHQLLVKQQQWPDYLAQILNVLQQEKGQSLLALEHLDLKVTAKAQAVAQMLLQDGSGCVVVGLDALQHPQAAAIRQLACAIAKLSGCESLFLTDAANSAGAAWAGCLPHRAAGGLALKQPGLDAQAMFTEPQRAYWLHGLEVEADCAQPSLVLHALQQAELVVCCHSYMTEKMQDYADIILPTTSWVDTAGSYINLLGQMQQVTACSVPQHDEKPDWKILAVLGRLLHIPGFDGQHVAQVRDQLTREVQSNQAYQAVDTVDQHVSATGSHQSQAILQAAINHVDWHTLLEHSYLEPYQESSQLQRIGGWPMYRVDSVVRRASALQHVFATAEPFDTICLNHATAERLQLCEGDMLQLTQTPVTSDTNTHDTSTCCKARLRLDARLADDMLWMPAATPLSIGFGMMQATINVQAITAEGGQDVR